MTSEPGRANASGMHPWGFLSLSLLYIATDRYWPGTAAATVIKYVFFSWMPIWCAVKIRAGYMRRKPYWTRESWLRYLRLAVMPIIALALVMFVSSFDMSSNTLGAPRSTTRAVIVISMIVVMMLGAFGLVVSVDWLGKGEASEQFTRTRWFQRRVPG